MKILLVYPTPPFFWRLAVPIFFPCGIFIGFYHEIPELNINSRASWDIPKENVDECIRLIDKA